jgi:hypothetical protein
MTTRTARRLPALFVLSCATTLIVALAVGAVTPTAAMAAGGAATAISSKLSVSKASVGSKVTFSGKLTSKGKAVAKKKVVVQQRAVGAKKWKELDTVKTTRTGKFSLKVTVKNTTTYRAVFEGTSSLAAKKSDSEKVTATAPLSGIAFSGARTGNTVTEGDPLSVSGTVSKLLKGKPVELQLSTTDPTTGVSTWTTAATGVVDAAGNFRVPFHTNGGGDFTYRVTVPAIGGIKSASAGTVTLHSWAWYTLYHLPYKGQNQFVNGVGGFGNGYYNENVAYFAPTSMAGAVSSDSSGLVINGTGYNNSVNLWHLDDDNAFATYLEWTLDGRCTAFSSDAAGARTSSDLTQIAASMTVNGAVTHSGIFTKNNGTQVWKVDNTPIQTLRLQADTIVAQGSGFGYPEFGIGNAKVYCKP